MKDAMESEAPFNISLISFVRNPFDVWARKPLLADGAVSAGSSSLPLKFLIDTGATGYAFIDEGLADQVCEKLQIARVRLDRPRPVEGYDGQVAPKPITHAIYPTLTVEGHKELTAPMFITRLGHQGAILGSPWMTCHGVWPDLINHSIVFTPNFCDHFGADYSRTRSLPKFLDDAARERKQQESAEDPQEDKGFRIHEINAAAYHTLMKQPKEENVQLFSLSVRELDEKLKFLSQDAANVLKEMYLKDDFAENPATDQEIDALLPNEYRDYRDVFDRRKADELPPHRQYDHRIELTGEGIPPRSKIYPLSGYKLQKMKEYIAENLKKGFIEPSQAPYSSPILFALKANGDLRFCVDYRGLNAITKRNRYPIPLIDEVLARVLGCKYMTRVDIIAAFNKLRMHPGSEDLTTFITSLGAFKYKVLPFGLTSTLR